MLLFYDLQFERLIHKNYKIMINRLIDWPDNLSWPGDQFQLIGLLDELDWLVGQFQLINYSSSRDWLVLLSSINLKYIQDRLGEFILVSYEFFLYLL
jgi:hypothetical protein